MPLPKNELIDLLSNTDGLVSQIYWFKHTIEKPKGGSHRSAAIKYVDIKEKRADFIRELKSTMLNWVYSKKKYESRLQWIKTKKQMMKRMKTMIINYIVNVIHMFLKQMFIFQQI